MAWLEDGLRVAWFEKVRVEKDGREAAKARISAGGARAP